MHAPDEYTWHYQMDAQRNFFGLKRLDDIVQTRCLGSAQSICDGLVDTVLRFQGDVPQNDYTAIVSVRVVGMARDREEREGVKE